jgi:hypothetical protein
MLKSKKKSISTKIFHAIKAKGASSLRAIATKIDVPKSTLCNQHIKQQERIAIVGHDFFETDEGRFVLHQLMVSVLLVFGIKGGVGGETIALFFDAFLSKQYIASSPSMIRIFKVKMRSLIDVYGDIEIDELLRRIKNIDLHLGMDETFNGSKLYLVLAEMASGFIIHEGMADDRRFDTWIEHVGGFLSRFKANIKSLISDGGVVLLKIGVYIECENFMDLFHGMKDIKSLFATKFHSKREFLAKKIRELKANPEITGEDEKSAIKEIKSKQALIDKGQKLYHQSLFEISTQSHPFKNVNEHQTSAELKSMLDAKAQGLREMSEQCEIIDKKKLLDRFEKRTNALSLINDEWHTWVDDSVQELGDDKVSTEWSKTILLPNMYWKEQLRKSKNRSFRLREFYQAQVLSSQTTLDNHPMTDSLMDDDRIGWAVIMSIKYQRTTSAIEGRNAQLDKHYYDIRGSREKHAKSQTVLHNFWLRRKDGTTACERLSGYDPPNLYTWLLNQMDEMPLPRKSKLTLAA